MNRAIQQRTLAVAIGGALLTITGATAAAAPDWSKVPAKEIGLFFPGTASLEWVLNGPDHSGSRALRNGESCASCHDKETADIGDKIVSGKRDGIASGAADGKPGQVPVTVQAAHDGTNLYVRLQWADTKFVSGTKMDAKNQVKAALMLSVGKDVLFGAEGGCWASCHHDLRSMPDVSADAAKHASAKALNIQADGPTKYLRESRTAIELRNSPRGGWDKLAPDTDIAAALAGGKFLELLQYRSSEEPQHGYVLDGRKTTAAPGLATGGIEGGKWTVVFTRKLAAGAGSHALAAGTRYNLGVALHDDYTDRRFHYVSLGYSLALDDASADINAIKQ
ncbi:MAG: hypothetical protein IT494_07045 [Gammaproteobacteria bacterium]|nr:hypothetical protein [Gammaproteobacteria bacterium]